MATTLPAGLVLDPLAPPVSADVAPLPVPPVPPAPAAVDPSRLVLDPLPKSLVLDPVTPPAETSWAENVLAGMGERAAKLGGNVVDFVTPLIASDYDRIAADLARQNNDMAAKYPDLAKPISPADAVRLRAGVADKINAAGADFSKNFDIDLGYNQRTTWEDFKKQPLTAALPFILENGLVSVPDMIAAGYNPAAYGISMAGEMGKNRATNDGRTNATVEDMVGSLPAAAAMALLERLGARSTVGAGETALTNLVQLPAAAGKATVTEGLTEAGQQVIQSTQETLGTKDGFDFWRTLEETGAAAIAGAGFGGLVRGGEGIGEVAKSKLARATPGFDAETSPITPGGPPQGLQLDPVQPEPPAPAAPVINAPVAAPPPAPAAPAAPAPAPVATAAPPAAPAAPPVTVLPPAEPLTVAPPPAAAAPEPAPAPVAPVIDPVQPASPAAPPPAAAAPEPAPAPPAAPQTAPEPVTLAPAPAAPEPAPVAPQTAPEPVAAAPQPEPPGIVKQEPAPEPPATARELKTPDDYAASLNAEGYQTSPLERLKTTASKIAAEPLSGKTVQGAGYAGHGQLFLRADKFPTFAAAIKNGQTAPTAVPEDVMKRVIATADAKAAKPVVWQTAFNAAGDKTQNVLGVAANGQTVAMNAKIWSYLRAQGIEARVAPFTDPKNPAPFALFQGGNFVGLAAPFTAPNLTAADPAALGPKDYPVFKSWSDWNKVQTQLARELGQAQRNHDKIANSPKADEKKVAAAKRALDKAQAAYDLHQQAKRPDAKAAKNPIKTPEPQAAQSPVKTPAPAAADPVVSTPEPAKAEAQTPAPVSSPETAQPASGPRTQEQAVREMADAWNRIVDGGFDEAAVDKELPALEQFVKDAEQFPELADRIDPADDVSDDEMDFDPELDDLPEVADRKSRGTLTPGMEEVSYTKRGSIHEEAYRAAGFDPDKAVLFAPERQLRILADLMQRTFGLTMNLNVDRAKISAIDARDQMLDAYRNVRFMLSVLGLPNEALGLGGKLTLALERSKGQYLGAYNPATRTIHMPDRSNSFAHEWAHALDHHLLDLLKPNTPKTDALLTRMARNDAVLDPAVNLEQSFARLINTMFYDDAALALKRLALEQEAAKVDANGIPLKIAAEAQRQIELLDRGASRLHIKPSGFRSDSANYAPSAAGYFASVHEMLARTMEAYVAHRVEMAGGTNEFITKGDEAYLSNADRRLAMTFPKAAERARIFAAMDDVFHHLRNAAVLGTGPAATQPTNQDVIDPLHWHKVVVGMDGDSTADAFKNEVQKIKTSLTTALSQPVSVTAGNVLAELKANAGLRPDSKLVEAAPHIARATADIARGFTYSNRAIMSVIVKRNKGRGADFYQFLKDKIANDIGTGREGQGVTFEEARERRSNAAGSYIKNLLYANGFRNLKLSEAENDTVRELMFGNTNTPASPELVKVAAGLRRLYNETYRHGLANGVKMGFVSDKGYLQRIVNTAAVQDAPDSFVKDATKVYEIVFDNTLDKFDPDTKERDLLRLAYATSRVDSPELNPARDGPFAPTIRQLRKALRKLSRAVAAAEEDPTNTKAAQAAADAEQEVDNLYQLLADQVRPVFARTSAEAWKERIAIGQSTTYDSHGPHEKFTEHRELPSEADAILEKWYDTDVLHLSMSYAHAMNSRAAYLERFGNPSGAKRLGEVLQRQSVQDAVRMNPNKYDTSSPAGRLNILRDLANPRTDNLMEIALSEADRAGGYGPDARKMRSIIESITGRTDRGAIAEFTNKASSGLYFFTYLSLLPRAAWTAFTEPLIVMMRTGDMKATARTLQRYALEAVRGAKSTKEIAAIAELAGIVSTQLHDTVLLNRLSGDFSHHVGGNVIMTRFFRANWLTQLTNGQRRAVMAGGFYWMRDLAEVWRNPATDPIKRRIIENEFRDLGVPSQHFDAFTDWLTQKATHPTLDDMKSKAGQLYLNAVARYTDQTIQNPRRADKAMLAAGPVGRLTYSLASYLYTFFQNVHVATAKRAVRNYKIARDEGAGRGRAALEAAVPASMTLVGGFATMMIAQSIVSLIREAIFNPEQWEEKAKDGELGPWVMGLAWSRTGFFGPGDLAVQWYTGLKYERDLTSITAGPGLGMILSHIQNILNGLPGAPRNSPNSNTAERTAIKSAYKLIVAPLLSWGISAVPAGGPVTSTARFIGLNYATSNAPATATADVLVGEQRRLKKGDEGYTPSAKPAKKD